MKETRITVAIAGYWVTARSRDLTETELGEVLDVLAVTCREAPGREELVREAAVLEEREERGGWHVAFDVTEGA